MPSEVAEEVVLAVDESPGPHAIGPVAHPAGKLDADEGHDSKADRAYLRRRRIAADRVVEAAGGRRWRVEGALSWLSCSRRLQVPLRCDSDRFFAFVLLACALVCFKRL